MKARVFLNNSNNKLLQDYDFTTFNGDRLVDFLLRGYHRLPSMCFLNKCDVYIKKFQRSIKRRRPKILHGESIEAR